MIREDTNFFLNDKYKEILTEKHTDYMCKKHKKVIIKRTDFPKDVM